MAKYAEELIELLRKGTKILMPGDSKPAYRYSVSDIADIQGLQEAETIARYLEHGITLQTPSEARQKTFCKLAPTMLRIVGDSVFNMQTGFGTLLDPAQYTHPIMPIMCGAGDASSIYAGGGLPAAIIDKKSTAMVLDGTTFKASTEDFWTADRKRKLEDAAQETGFNDAAGDCIRDAYLFGGAIIYPIFKTDRIASLYRNINDMELEKNCIKRWVQVDRWNTVYVPSFFPTAADYLKPKSMMVLQEAVEVSTSRICIVKPKPMPYWAAIANMGWSPSDIAGWLQAYYAYETTQMAIPVMAQQMSLLLYRMPLDALNATVGVNGVEKLMAVNEEQMKNWSALSPKAVNMVGEVEVVDRTYSGFEQFVGAIKSDFAAQTEIPEPALWHTPNKGFSDNTQESLLKQSETLQMRQHYIERYMQTAKDILIAHVWGSNSEEYKNRASLQLKFDKPMITTETELADVGARYAASINSFVQAGLSPDTAMSIAKSFFPSVTVTDEMLAEVKKSYETRMEQESMGMSEGVGQGGSLKKGNNKVGSKASGTGVRAVAHTSKTTV